MNYIHQLRSGELFALTIFLSVAAHRNFRLAAVELNMTPSAVSHAIKNLEDKLNIRLFNRTTRNVALTDAGYQLYHALRPAMNHISDAINQLDSFRSAPNGVLRINASEGAIRIILQPILKKFLSTYPLIHLDLASDGKLINIIEQQYDAGIRLADDIPQDMVAIRLTPYEKFVAVASPDYLQQHGSPKIPSDLYQHQCIRFRFESGKIFQWEFNIDGHIKKFDVNGALTLTDQQLMVDAAIDGIGIAFVAEFLAKPAIQAGKLVVLLEKFNPSYAGLCLYYPGHRHVSAALHALIEMIKTSGINE